MRPSASMSQGNGLAQNKWQANVWTNNVIDPCIAHMGTVAIYKISIQNVYQPQILWNLVCQELIAQLSKCLENLHRAWQCCCSDTALLCEKFQNDWAAEMDVMGKWDCVKFETRMSLGQTSYILSLASMGSLPHSPTITAITTKTVKQSFGMACHKETYYHKAKWMYPSPIISWANIHYVHILNSFASHINTE